MDQERRDFLQGSARLGGFALAGAALWRIEPVLAQSGPGHELATMTIVELSQLLASGKITSRQLVEQALAAIKDPGSIRSCRAEGVLRGGLPSAAETHRLVRRAVCPRIWRYRGQHGLLHAILHEGRRNQINPRPLQFHVCEGGQRL